MRVRRIIISSLKFPPVPFMLAILVASLIVQSIGYLYPSLMTSLPVELIMEEEAPPEEERVRIIVLIFKESPEGYGFNGTQENPIIHLKRGEPVRILLINEGAHVHNLAIPDLNISSGYVQPSKSRYINLKPEIAGKFTYFCEVDDHRWLGMESNIIVEE